MTVGTEMGGRRAIVAGGGGGIGMACVGTLLGAGAGVASIDLPDAPCHEGAARFDCDLADASAIDRTVAEIAERIGGIDTVVHCAGIVRDSVLWKMDPAAWSDVLRVNLDSAFHLMRAAIPVMRRNAAGAVVLVSSINGERGKFGQSNYAASKAGLISLGRSLAREVGRFGIRVNVVAPGMIDTAMAQALPADVRRQAEEETALGAIGEPDDVANAALFLVSDMARHVTGQVLRVDGGQLMA